MHEAHSQDEQWESKWLKSTENILGQKPGLRGCQIRGQMPRAHKGRKSCTEPNERALTSRKPKAKRISTQDSDNPMYSSAEVFHSPPAPRAKSANTQAATSPSPAAWKLRKQSQHQPRHPSQHSIRGSTSCLSARGKLLVTLSLHGIADKVQSG